jgi:chaperonin GroES
MQITPLFDRVLIKPTKPKTTTQSGLSITTKEDTLYKSGIVVSVGNGIKDDSQKVEMQLCVGDQVIFDEYTATKINLQDIEHYLIKQTDILALIKE